MSAWVSFGPRQLGGSVSYVITHGISMEPRVQEGDLVILREAPHYRAGDVIGYESPSLGQPVMHRIVRRGPDGYVTKGDNNDWLDTDRPTDADVLGKEWVHIPRAGKALRLVATPPGAAAVAGILGLLLFAGNSEKKRRARKGATVHGTRAGGLWDTSPVRRVLLCATAALALGSLLLGGLALTTEPISSLRSEAAYTHAGEFAYSARAEAGPVYRDGLATTGEPLFINLIDEIDFSFRYRMKTELPSEITGKAMLWARVSDGSGWKQALRLQEEIAFGGDTVALEGTLDPREVQDLVARVQEQTGVVGGGYTITLLPTIVVEGTIGDHNIEERYTPTLDLDLENNQLALAAGAGDPASDGTEGVDPLRPRKTGSLETSEIEPNTVGIFALEMPVESARRFSLFGLLLAAAAAFWLWQTSGAASDADEVTLIQARYGPSMIPVTNLSAQARDRSIEVADMDGLVRLAEHADRMILHEQEGGVHRYFVEDEGVAYVYQPKGGPRLQPEPAETKPVEPEPVVVKAVDPEPVVAKAADPEPAKAVPTASTVVEPKKAPRAKTTAKATTAKTSSAKTTSAKSTAAKKTAAKSTSTKSTSAKKTGATRTPKPRPETSSS